MEVKFDIETQKKAMMELLVRNLHSNMETEDFLNWVISMVIIATDKTREADNK